MRFFATGRPRRAWPRWMARSVNMPLRCDVRITAPLKVVAMAFCRPTAVARR